MRSHYPTLARLGRCGMTGLVQSMIYDYESQQYGRVVTA